MEEKKYELLEVMEDGTEVRRYLKDNSLRDQNGYWLDVHPGGEGHQITKENVAQFHRRRKEKILEAIEAELTDLTKSRAPAEAIGKLVRKRAEIAMSDDGRTGNEAAKIVLQAVDAYQARLEKQAPQVQRHEYAIDSETLEMLKNFAAMKRGEVLNGEEVDSE